MLSDSIIAVAADALVETGDDNNTSYAERQRNLLIGKLVYVVQPDRGVVQLNVPEEKLLIADSSIQLSSEDLGRQVVIQFGQDRTQPPVVLGLIQSGAPTQPSTPNHLVLQAQQQIELRCGSSSIVLTANGKIMIRGDYVVSRSTGVNRVDGASVQIN